MNWDRCVQWRCPTLHLFLLERIDEVSVKKSHNFDKNMTLEKIAAGLSDVRYWNPKRQGLKIVAGGGSWVRGAGDVVIALKVKQRKQRNHSEKYRRISQKKSSYSFLRRIPSSQTIFTWKSQIYSHNSWNNRSVTVYVYLNDKIFIAFLQTSRKR